MNRRKFLKSISNFLIAIPFISFFNYQYGGIVDDPPVIVGIDRGIKQDSYSVSFMATTIDGKSKFIPLHEYANHMNCRCNFEWIEIE